MYFPIIPVVTNHGQNNGEHHATTSNTDKDLVAAENSNEIGAEIEETSANTYSLEDETNVRSNFNACAA
jgi:hypothetical protein